MVHVCGDESNNWGRFHDALLAKFALNFHDNICCRNKKFLFSNGQSDTKLAKRNLVLMCVGAIGQERIFWIGRKLNQGLTFVSLGGLKLICQEMDD